MPTDFQSPSTAPSNWYKPWEVAELIKAGPRPQDLVQFSEYIADHLNRALRKGYAMGMHEAPNAPGEPPAAGE